MSSSRTPKRLIEPCSRGVSILTRGCSAIAAPRVSAACAGATPGALVAVPWVDAADWLAVDGVAGAVRRSRGQPGRLRWPHALEHKLKGDQNSDREDDRDQKVALFHRSIRSRHQAAIDRNGRSPVPDRTRCHPKGGNGRAAATRGRGRQARRAGRLPLPHNPNNSADNGRRAGATARSKVDSYESSFAWPNSTLAQGSAAPTQSFSAAPGRLPCER